MFDQAVFPDLPQPTALAPLMTVRDVSLWYGEKQALKDVNLEIFPRECVAFIGPSGCGKTTLLKCLNRMHDGTRDVHMTGEIRMSGHNVMAPDIDPPMYRRRFGWVAQRPNPFAWSVYDNVAYGARLHGLFNSEAEVAAHVEICLRAAELWDEVKDTMKRMQGTELSGGQQQRLCIARALSTKPDMLLMDEPTGSIDPIATAKIEELILSLKEELTVVVITHSMMQARRVSDRVAYFQLGELLEVGETEALFTNAQHPDCRDYLAGKFG